jgi:hypothetical protein
MNKSVTIDRQMLGEFKNFKMPSALKQRLNDLLDKQDELGKLTARERKEAEALAQLAEFLTLIKLRAMQSQNQSN